MLSSSFLIKSKSTSSLVSLVVVSLVSSSLLPLSKFPGSSERTRVPVSILSSPGLVVLFSGKKCVVVFHIFPRVNTNIKYICLQTY